MCYFQQALIKALNVLFQSQISLNLHLPILDESSINRNNLTFQQLVFHISSHITRHTRPSECFHACRKVNIVFNKVRPCLLQKPNLKIPFIGFHPGPQSAGFLFGSLSFILLCLQVRHLFLTKTIIQVIKQTLQRQYEIH